MKSKYLISIGSAILASKLARTLSNVTADNLLGRVGLARRSNRTLEGLALIGLGAAIGAGTALLLAPSSGEETRKRLGEGLNKAGDRGKELVQEAKRRAPEVVENAKSKLREIEDSVVHQRSYES